MKQIKNLPRSVVILRAVVYGQSTLLGCSFMKTVTGFGANRTWMVQTFRRLACSWELMVLVNSEFVIPQRACSCLDCLKALQVRRGPPKRRHVDLMAISQRW